MSNRERYDTFGMEPDTDAQHEAPWDTSDEVPAEGASADNAEAEQPEQPKERKSNCFAATIMSLLSGSILSKKEVKQTFPLMAIIVALTALFMYSEYRTQHLYREQQRLVEEVKELRSSSMSIASEKMKATRQSNIMSELAKRGIPLHESLTPNKIIPR
jgi:hypothetical protein